MDGEVFLSDNSGNRVPPDPEMVDPVAASGITLTIVNDGQDYQEPLVGGQLYAITFFADKIDSYILASITGVTSVVINREWIFPANKTCIFRMPMGKTILYYESNDSGTVAYIRKLAD